MAGAPVDEKLTGGSRGRAAAAFSANADIDHLLATMFGIANEALSLRINHPVHQFELIPGR